MKFIADIMEGILGFGEDLYDKGWIFWIFGAIVIFLVWYFFFN